MEVVRVVNLCRHYIQGDTVIEAVEALSFTIKKGEFVTITGASGSGKTTLLNLIGGVDKPTCGEIYIDGIDIRALSATELGRLRRQKLGYIFQNYNLIPILTAQENIVMPSLLDGRKVDKEYFAQLVDVLGIADRIYHLPGELSGGQQQRVAVARALINRPSLILADEPTGNLDKKSAEELLDLIEQVNRLGNTIIMVTHDQNIANRASRILHMDNGKIKELS